MKRGSLILSLFLVSILFISGCAELGPKNISDCALIYEGVCTSSTTPTKDHMILGGVGDFGCEGDNNDPNMEVVYSRPAPGSNLKSSNSGEYCHIPIGKVENYAEEQGMTGSTGDSDENRNVCCYNMYSDPYCSSISWLNSVYNQYYSAMGGNVEPIDDFCCGNPAAQYNGIGLENTNMCWGGPSNDFYLASNTIWCENAQIGDTGIVDGITYLAVDNDMLHAMDPSIDNYVTVCTSHVTSMHTLFYNDNFNQDISRWDTSSVTDMRAMFSYSTFNRDIGNWDVSSVTDMGAMFMAAHSFNQLISSWDVSSVTNMEDMFSDAYDFNLPIGNWDTSSVTTMANMFSMSYTGVGDFNQPIGNWDTSSVTNMGWMFYGAHSFNQPIGNWDVSSVTRMESMFMNVENFNQPLGDWDTSRVTDMSYMFYGAEGESMFNQPIGDWDTSSVIDMEYMFSEASSFNQPIVNWDVNNVQSCINFRRGWDYNPPTSALHCENVPNNIPFSCTGCNCHGDNCPLKIHDLENVSHNLHEFMVTGCVNEIAWVFASSENFYNGSVNCNPSAMHHPNNWGGEKVDFGHSTVGYTFQDEDIDGYCPCEYNGSPNCIPEGNPVCDVAFDQKEQIILVVNDGPASQCSTEPVFIPAGEFIEITYDGGQTKRIYLPEINLPDGNGGSGCMPSLVLWIDGFGNTYYDEGLLDLAGSS